MKATTPRTGGIGPWCALYRVLLGCLPRGLRERHGAAMLDLYAQELAQQGGSPLRLGRVAVAGIADLVFRGVVERVADERRMLGQGGWAAMRTLGTGSAIAFVTMTTLLLLHYIGQRLPGLSAERGAALVWYAIPFTIALTIPASLFVGVLWGLTRAGTAAPGAPPPAPSVRLLPLVVGAAAVALLAGGLTTEVVPRANARLLTVLTGRVNAPTDRTRTLAALHARGRALDAVPAARRDLQVRQSLASVRVEIHKKFALPAACMVLTLLAASLARWAPRAGIGRLLVTTVVVFGGYYLLLMGGETLADQSLVSPGLAMWSANALALLLALVARRATPHLATAAASRAPSAG